MGRSPGCRYIKDLLRGGSIDRFFSPFSSLSVFLSKKDKNEVRIDFMKLAAVFVLSMILVNCGGGSENFGGGFGKFVENNDSNNSENNHFGNNANNSQSTIVRLSDRIYINTEDNVVVYIDPTLDKNEKLIYDTNKTREITKNLYKYFKDEFDFIFLITNN